MRKVAVLVIALSLTAPRSAQAFAVTDALALIQSGIILVQQKLQLDEHGSVRRWLRRMGRSISIYVSVARYVPTGPPRWRTFNGRGDAILPEAQRVIDRLNGIAAGPLLVPVAMDPEIGALPSAVEAGLAALDVRTAAIEAAVTATGQIRAQRRQERRSLFALEEDTARAGGGLGDRLGVLTMAAVLRSKARSDRLQLQIAAAELATADLLASRQVEAETAAARAALLVPVERRGTPAADAIRSWRLR